jgi:hypothetical protein
MAKTEKQCQNCNKTFLADNREINRGNAKYCSQSCAGKMPKMVQYKLICKHCSREFFSSNQKTKMCSLSCKQKNYRLRSKSQNTSIKQFYKLFEKVPCEICQWSEAPRDLHHITSVAQGGKNELNNLISVCPNHHRMIHTNLISKDDLYQVIKNRTISSS